MATLQDISRQVSSELARPELVADFANADYTPTATFLRIINAAGRRLERMVDYVPEFRRISKEIVAGQYFVNLPKQLQYIDQIDIENSTSRYQLEPQSDRWMREKFDEPFDNVDVGQPLYWSRWIPDGERFENLVVNGDFASDTSSWTESGGILSWSAGKAKLASSGAGSGMYQEFSPAIDIRGHRLNFSVSTSGNVTNYWVSLWNGATGIIMLPLDTDGLVYIDERMAYFVEQGLQTQEDVDAVVQACDKIAVVMLGDSGAYIEVDNVSINTALSSTGNLLIMPPADAAYTLYVKSKVYTDEMVDLSDTTWWSNRHPDLLVTFVKRQIAVELNRNQTEVSEYDDEIAPQLFEIERCAAAEEQAGGPETIRMGYSL